MNGYTSKHTVADAITGKHRRIEIRVNNSCVLIRPEGTKTCSSVDGLGWPIMVEFVGGRPSVNLWCDINQDDVTLSIDMSGAMESERDEA